MSRLKWLVPVLALLAFAGCGPVEVRISKSEGVKAINGTLSASFNTGGQTFVCGDTIIGSDSTQEYTVVTRVVSGGCEFNFDQQVEVLAGADYATIKEFKDAVHYLNRVELQVNRLELFDDQGVRFDLSRIRELELSVNGQRVLNIDEVGRLPTTVVLSGDALKALKTAVKNRERCTAHVVAHVVLLDAATPTGVRCEYESQPTFVVSTLEL